MSAGLSSIEVVGIAVGLAMDTLAVSIAASVVLKQVNHRQVFRFAFHFGLFQAFMPVIGWLAGKSVVSYISLWDHWIAFALLAFVGGKMVHEAFENEDAESGEAKTDPTKGMSLVILSTATSIDALAVGLSFAMLEMDIWTPCAIIGVVCSLITTVGMLVGMRLGTRFGKKMEIVGGLVLICIGLKIVFDHLWL